MDILELYMILGGVPYYLEQTKRGLSVQQITQKLLFDSDALLKEEYQNLFAALFNNPERYYAVMSLLSQKKKGLSRSEIKKKAKFSDGSLKEVLAGLKAAGFIEKYVPYGKAKRGSFYRIIDEFCLFYLHWMKPIEGKVVNPSYWHSVQQGSRWSSWAGYAFEGICEKHSHKLLEALGISGIESVTSKWRCGPNEKLGLPGAEIDLLIDRADRIINVCDMKFTRESFVATPEYVKKLRTRLAVFAATTGAKKSLVPTLVCATGAVETARLREAAATVIELDDLF